MSTDELLLAFDRHKILIAVGCALGAAVAFLVLYQVSLVSGRIQFEPRGKTQYETVSIVLIDTQNHAIASADPPLAKPVQVAPTYAYLAQSSLILAQVQRETGPLRATVKVEAPDQQPFIKITVDGENPGYIQRVASSIGGSLGKYLTDLQQSDQVPAEQRIIVSPLGAPSTPIALQSRTWEFAAIAFVIPVILFLGIVVLVDRTQMSRAKGAVSASAPASPGSHVAGHPAPHGAVGADGSVEVQEMVSAGGSF